MFVKKEKQKIWGSVINKDRKISLYCNSTPWTLKIEKVLHVWQVPEYTKWGLIINFTRLDINMHLIRSIVLLELVFVIYWGVNWAV